MSAAATPLPAPSAPPRRLDRVGAVVAAGVLAGMAAMFVFSSAIAFALTGADDVGASKSSPAPKSQPARPAPDEHDSHHP